MQYRKELAVNKWRINSKFVRNTFLILVGLLSTGLTSFAQRSNAFEPTSKANGIADSSLYLINAKSDIGIRESNHLPGYRDAVNRKLSKFSNRSEKYTVRTLDKLMNREKEMQQKVAKVNPVAATKLFAYSLDSLNKLKGLISGRLSRVNKVVGREYFSYLDTLKQALSFLSAASGKLSGASNIQDQFLLSLDQLRTVETNLDNIENIQNYLSKRQQVINAQLSKFPRLRRELVILNKRIYYYKAQIEEYKASLKDLGKLEKLILSEVEMQPAFQRLMQENSQLSGLFPSSLSFGKFSGSGKSPIVNGIADRAVVQQFIKLNIPSASAANPLQKMQSQLIGSSNQLGQIQDKLDDAGNRGNMSLRDFMPNNQKTKSLGKRLQWGTDFQFGAAVNYMPATANLGVKAGYRLNDKFILGTGIGYILGLGSGWKHIHFSNQGIGLRSFLKWTVSKGWDIQGGAEWNYMTQFYHIQELKQFNAWQTSVLLGIGKRYKFGKKLQGNFQILFDALYNQHIPITQPVVFRFGYDL